MELKTIFDFFNRLSKDNLSFLYHGGFNDEYTEKIINISEINIDKLGSSASLKGKIAFLVAESFQNIVRHGDTPDNKDNYSVKTGIFIIRNIGFTYYITSANLVSNKHIDSLANKLSKINELNADKLKELYLDILGEKGFSDRGGAGLGLVEMARKTGQKLEYEFESVNKDFSYFYLQLKLNTDKNIRESQTNKNRLISSSKKFHEVMNKNNIFLAYKGDFSHETILSILKIIDRNLQLNPFEHTPIKRMLYHLLAEMLQNVRKHSYSEGNKKEGIFLIGKYKKHYIISTGNYIKNELIKKFSNQVDELNQSDKEQLTQLFKDKLRNGKVDENGSAGLGLIDIVRECSGDILYQFTPVNKDISFLTLSIQY